VPCQGLIVWPDFSLSKNQDKKIISGISVCSNDPASGRVGERSLPSGTLNDYLTRNAKLGACRSGRFKGLAKTAFYIVLDIGFVIGYL
jgi:hypothetical protein